MGNYITCEECGGKFTYLEVNGGFPGGKEREYIYCPHCDAVNGSGRISGVFATRKYYDDEN